MVGTGGDASVRQHSIFFCPTNKITEFVGKSACPVGLPRAIQRCGQLVHAHGQLNKYWEHSHRPFPSRKPSFHSISVMCRFWVCLFDTRSAHQNARWSKCPTHDHKHRVNPFNIAGSAQPRFTNGFRISKRFFFFFVPPPGHKEAKSSLFFLTS